MKTALILYTDGTGDIEVTAALDVLHRGGVKITTAAVTDESSRMVPLAHGTVVVCDTNIDELEGEYDLIVIPGGPGTRNMAQNGKVIDLLKDQKAKGKLIGAICAAPGVVLYSHGLIDDKTTALFFEVITNPQLFVADIKALSEIAHAKGVPLIADTTVVPFSAFRAVDFGVDIEVVSSTKYISGGGTGLGGLLIDYGKFDWSQSPSPALQGRTKRVGKKLAFTARVKTELVTNLGALMTPQVAYMETLGLDTLDIRFHRQAETTLWLAKQCQALPEIKRVNYTGLEENPFYELSKAQFGPLPGAVFTIDLASKEAAWAFIDRLQIIRRATNLFDRKSLAIHPASTIFGLFTPEQCAEMSVSDTTIRLSIGLEDGEDLLEDIKQSLK